MKQQFLDKKVFVDRVSAAVLSGQRPVVFLLGSGVAIPDLSGLGVPSANDIIALVRNHLGDDYEQTDSYQSIFKQLQEKRGQDAANQIIQNAVLRSRVDYSELNIDVSTLSSSHFRNLEAENMRWHVPEGILAVASLCAHFPHKFGSAILTTNFDPLLEVALTRQRTPWFSSALHSDGSLLYIRGEGTHIVHLHGYWWGSDTLHTSSQLTVERPQLSGSLNNLLRDCTLVVVGYGGWDDTFMSTLDLAVRSNSINIDILWGFYSEDIDEITSNYSHVTRALSLAYQRGRANFFRGISAERAFTEIFKVATNRIPAENIELFLSRVELTRTHLVKYSNLCTPWRDPETSIGNYLKLLAKFNVKQVALASLFAVEYLLPQLERQIVHGAPKTSKYDWVRKSITKSRALLENGQQNDSWLQCAVIDMFEIVEEKNNDLNSMDRATLMAAAQATCACLAVISSQNIYKVGYGEEYPSEVWAAKSIHCSARAIHDDDGALWGYVTRRLTGGYNHLSRFE